MPESGHQVRFCLDVPGDVHWMKQSKLNLPNAFPKFGEPFFVSVHPTPELVLFTVIFATFSLFVKQPRNQLRTLRPLRLLSTRSWILLPWPCWINAWFVWQSTWFGHDLGPLGGGQQRLKLNIKCWCVSYVKSLSVPWLLIGCLSDDQWSNCIHASYDYM